MQVKGTTRRAKADEQGRFTIRAPAGDVVLVVRRIGYRPMEVAVAANESVAAVTLSRAALDLDAIVVNGQASGVERRHAATAVTIVKGEDLTRVSQQTIEHGLQGKIPGAQISQRTGAPGGWFIQLLQGIGNGWFLWL